MMKKLLILTAVLASSLVAAQNSFNLAELIQTKASTEFLFTGIDIPELQKIMGDTSKSDTQKYAIEREGFTMKYVVTKDIQKNFVTLFESTMTYYVTWSAWNTSQGWMIGTVTSAQKASLGRGNDLEFVSVDSKKMIRTVLDLDTIYAFTNGKCKVPKENTVFKLEPGSDTIKISGFDIYLSGKKYGLKAELNRKDTKFVLNKNGTCK
jgi:hypothetical protein